MTKDFEDTIVVGASPSPLGTPAADDIFQPGVRVILGWSDIEAAVASGAIAAAEARPLWARWVADGCVTQPPAFASAPPVEAPPARLAPLGGPRFSFTNTLYYFGGMVGIGAMSLFMTLGWQSFGAWGLALIGTGYLLACLLVADHLKKRSLPVPAGILATLAVVLAPLVVWSVQRRVFTVFGGLGVAMYLGYLSYKVFGNSLMFPFVLTLLGLSVVALGIWWQRHEDRISAAFSTWLPEGLRPR